MSGQFITLPTLQALDSFSLAPIMWEAGFHCERNSKPLLGFEVLLFPVIM